MYPKPKSHARFVSVVLNTLSRLEKSTKFRDLFGKSKKIHDLYGKLIKIGLLIHHNQS